jgi:DNA-binding FadR family transcriptional regulator
MGSSRESPSVVKASELIANEIRRRIARAEFVEGDALPNETMLMEIYQVSRPTVRGALRILESESLLSVKQGPGGGARVRIPDVRVTARQVALHLQLADATMGELFEARALLEPAAARKLATAQDASVIAQLEVAHQREKDAVGDPVEYPRAAAAFHDLIIELAGNKTLTLLGRLLHEMVEAHNRQTFARVAQHVKLAELGVETHGTLLQLIRAGDATEAERFWRSHVDDAGEFALQSLGSRTIISIMDEAEQQSSLQASTQPE